MRQQDRRKRIAHLRQEAKKLRAEASRGFVDNVWNGRVLATADEIKSCAWQLIGDCERQAERLAEGLR